VRFNLQVDQRFDAFLGVILDAVYCSADFVCRHQAFIVWPQEASRLFWRTRLAKPDIIVLWQKHYRHAVVDTADKRVGFANNDRCRQSVFTEKTIELPDAREGERLQVLAPKTIRLLSVVALLPFVEACSWN